MEAVDRKVDVALALRAYEKIQRLGTSDAGGFSYKGLTATTDFDGYTVAISDGATNLRIFFHNRFLLEAKDGRAVEQFLMRLKRVALG